MRVTDGYSILVPLGWALLDAHAKSDRQLEAWCDATLATVGAKARALARPELMQRMKAMLEGLSERKGSAVMTQSAVTPGLPSNPMIVFTLLDYEAGSDPLDTVVAIASADATAEVLDTDDFAGIRTISEVGGAVELPGWAGGVMESLGASEKRSEVGEMLSKRRVRRVRYVIGRPDQQDRWLDIFAAIAYIDDPAGRDLADATAGLVDAVIKSVRWVES